VISGARPSASRCCFGGDPAWETAWPTPHYTFRNVNEHLRGARVCVCVCSSISSHQQVTDWRSSEDTKCTCNPFTTTTTTTTTAAATNFERGGPMHTAALGCTEPATHCHQWHQPNTHVLLPPHSPFAFCPKTHPGTRTAHRSIGWPFVTLGTRSPTNAAPATTTPCAVGPASTRAQHQTMLPAATRSLAPATSRCVCGRVGLLFHQPTIMRLDCGCVDCRQAHEFAAHTGGPHGRPAPPPSALSRLAYLPNDVSMDSPDADLPL
jgi:hypothetical protein